MIATGNPNINTREYWDEIYKKRQEYEVETGVVRFSEVLKLITDGQKILDIGCGIGTFCEMILDKFPNCEVWGVDISEQAIEDNKKTGRAKYYVSTVGKLSVPTNYFDVVFSGETLEHLDKPDLLFMDAWKALKKDGTFIVSTPRRDGVVSPEHTWMFDEPDIFELFYYSGFNSVEFINFIESRVILLAKGVKK